MTIFEYRVPFKYYLLFATMMLHIYCCMHEQLQSNNKGVNMNHFTLLKARLKLLNLNTRDGKSRIQDKRILYTCTYMVISNKITSCVLINERLLPFCSVGTEVQCWHC